MTEPQNARPRTEGQRLQNRAFFAIVYSLALFILGWLTYPYSPPFIVAAWALTWHLSSRTRRKELREAQELVERYKESEKRHLDTLSKN